MRVLLTTKSLLPDYGGPAFSVTRLASALVDAGADVGVWAPDRSAAITPLLPVTSPVQRIMGTEFEALDRFGQIDILHDNGIWLAHNHRLAVLAEKRGFTRVVSTRGMLEPWALRHKWLKKKCAWWLYQYRDLRKARCHISTASTEAQNLQRLGLGVPIATIPNGVDVLEGGPRSLGLEYEETLRNGRKRTALFLGRIYPIKGLPMLINAWARVRPEGWVLRIAGPDEAGHRKQLEKAVCAASLRESVSFIGAVEPHMKKSEFQNADLLVLPSHSESFGVVVVEALAHGLPVLTTTGTPWSILQERGCGWWVSATVDGLAEGLQRATSLQTDVLRAMGQKGRRLAVEQFGWKHIANLMLSTYEGVLAHNNRPRS